MGKGLFVIILILIVLGGILLFQNRKSQETLPFDSMKQTESYQTVSFITQDGVQIVGHHYAVENGRQAVLFLHMMPATKESWDSLARSLQEKGIASLAIDLRGHGESTRIKLSSEGQVLQRQSQELRIEELNYKDFTDREHQASKLDVEAALDWLQKEMNGGLERISLVGASIGANLTLQVMFEHPEIKKGVALSPGVNYRGIQPKQFVQQLKPDQEVFYATSKDDGNNVQETEELYNATKAQKQWKIYEGAGHGTTMLERSDDLLPSLIEFLVP